MPTPQDRITWVQTLIADLYPSSPPNIALETAFAAWTFAENGWFANDATYNCLNVTLQIHGSLAVIETGTPGVWVQSYPTEQDAISATADVLRQPNMAGISTALDWITTVDASQTAAVQRLADAVGASPWGTPAADIVGQTQNAIQLIGEPVTIPTPTPDTDNVTAEEKALDPVTDMAAMPNGRGYWVLRADGSVYAFGDAQYLGGPNIGPLLAAKDVAVAISSTPSGLGYWIASADGGVFSFGDAKFFGAPVAKTVEPPLP